MTDREAMKLALKALERSMEAGMTGIKVDQAITALRQALEQPEQEPVATLDDLEQEIYENTRQFVSRDVMEWMLKRYYTTPPQRKPLTDEQIDNTTRKQVYDLLDYIYEYGTAAEDIDFRVRAIARAIEAAHGITG